MPIYDSPAEDAAEHFDDVLDFIGSRLHYGGVLVHCNRGVSSSATFVVAAHLMRGRSTQPRRSSVRRTACGARGVPGSRWGARGPGRRAVRLVAGPARPSPAAAPAPGPARARAARAGPAPRPVATAPARPERAIEQPGRRAAQRRRGQEPEGTAASGRMAAATPGAGAPRFTAPRRRRRPRGGVHRSRVAT